MKNNILEYFIKNESDEIIYNGIELFEDIIDNILFIDENQKISINIPKFLRTKYFYNGLYKVKFNFYKMVIGNLEEKLIIKNISNSRKEVELVLLKENKKIENEIYNFSRLNDLELKYYLYFLDNLNSNLIINKKINKNDNLLIKLYNELSDEYNIKSECIIVEKILNEFEESLNLKTTFEDENNSINLNFLRGPNINNNNFYFDLRSTNFENFESLSNNNDNFIKTFYLSSSLHEGVDINIDYSNLSEFIYFSSAQKRIENFINKINTLEKIKQEINNFENLNNLSKDSIININNKLKNKYQHIINVFDGFEKYLFYENNYINKNNIEYFISSFPKDENGNLYLLNSLTVQQWIVSSINIAKKYDSNNLNYILRLVPTQILNNNFNKDYINFILMIAQIFDINYNYIKKINSINERENSINRGVANELLYNIINSLGFKLKSGTILNNLYNEIPDKIYNQL